MSKKENILLLLESQIDKIVLGAIILVSLVLLWLYVVGNPHGAKIRIGVREVSVTPGEIDRKINQEAERLLEKLGQPAQATQYSNYNKTLFADYTNKLQCAISDVPSDVAIPYPGRGDAPIEEKRFYAVPSVPPLSEVKFAVLRGAAQIPVEEVTPGTPYEMIETKLGDIDLATVSARFDIQRLYNNFQLSFNGPGLKSLWRDTRLAKPVLARIELQRRSLRQDGTWSDWSVVPRAKNDMYKKLLEQLPMQADQMQLGVSILMSQYESQDVQLDILQPAPYQFGVSRVEWMPPEYLTETLTLLEKEKDQQRRELLEERRNAAEKERRPAERGGDRRMPTAERGGDRRMPIARPKTPSRTVVPVKEPPTPAASRKPERTVQDIQNDAQKNMLKEEARLENLREPVLVWVHDDTTQPGQTYQYRVRLGVINPIAGKDWVREEQLEFNKQTVLWSDFSELTENIEIPKMLHVFPMETLAKKDDAKDIEGAKVEIAKYYMGRWQTYEFDTYLGQMIGHLIENTDDDGKKSASVMQSKSETASNIVETPVDYTSGMTLVDVIRQVNWGIRLRRTDSYNILYSDVDGLSQLAIGRPNWPKELIDAYTAVQDAMAEGLEERTRSIERGPEGMPIVPVMPVMPVMPR